MRILYVYHSDHSPQNAHSSQIIHTCSGLHEKGHEVLFVAAGDLEAYAETHELSMPFEVHQVRTVGIPLIDKTWHFLRAVQLGRTFDVVLTRDLAFLRLIRALPTSLTPPIVFEAHKSYSKLGDISQEEEISRLAGLDGVIAISEGIRSDLSDLGIEVNAVIHDAASQAVRRAETKSQLRTRLGLPTESIIYVYAGSLDPEKYAMDTIITALARNPPVEEFQLIVLGGTEGDIHRLREHADEVGLTNSVTFHGHVSQERVYDYLGASDVGIVAQQPDDLRASKYTSPLKLFEYLEAGLTVVASDVPSINEIVQDEPRIHLFDPNDLEDISRSCKLAALESGDSNENHIGGYTFDQRAQALEKVLKECL